ncbi:hypothetical protein [Arachnia propionica]|uniref:DUF8175 domain-containing protein n=1 Tax=Arachnia propionica TaxID=1750 RepID=A0A3P1WPA8_9ACTN|nr:hypothetical protein [Arachnia propionica]RRD47668.1 hypothetical protein EII35_14575 [Arachnia propionica]
MDEQKPKTSKWMVSSMVIVAAIVALAVFVIVSNLGARTEPAANTPTTTTPASATSLAGEPTTSTPPTQSSADGGASFCGLTAVEMNGTLTEAPAATWEVLGTTYVPSVDGHGPGKIDDDGYRHCYARTPTGALLAITNYEAIPQLQSDALNEKFIRTGIAPGPGRDAALEKLKHATNEPSESGERQTFQTIGFRILSYDGNSALVETVSRSNRGYKMAWAAHLIWAEGDWKLVPSDEGEDLTEPTIISTLDGYTPWNA